MEKERRKKRKKKMCAGGTEGKGKKGKISKRSPPASTSDAFRVSAKDGQSYAEILRVNSSDAGLEVLTIRRTRKEEILLILKKGGDVTAFKKAIG